MVPDRKVTVLSGATYALFKVFVSWNISEKSLLIERKWLMNDENSLEDSPKIQNKKLCVKKKINRHL